MNHIERVAEIKKLRKEFKILEVKIRYLYSFDTLESSISELEEIKYIDLQQNLIIAKIAILKFENNRKGELYE